MHFRGGVARCLDLTLQEFRSYFVDFSRLGAAKAACCEGFLTECKVCDALKPVGLKKSPRLDGLPYEVYLKLPHMFVPILADMFNHWFAQEDRMVISMTRKKGLYHDANFSHRDLILFFMHQLRVKIRCDRKRLYRITFDKRCVNAASLVV